MNSGKEYFLYALVLVVSGCWMILGMNLIINGIRFNEQLSIWIGIGMLFIFTIILGIILRIADEEMWG